MNEVLFLNKREQDWKRLQLLGLKADASPSNLSKEELKEFVSLYRKVCADLALVRTSSSNVQLIDFLNNLCARSYVQLYRPKRKSFWRSVAEFPALLADTVRRQRWCVGASALLLFGSAFVAFGVVRIVPDSLRTFIPAGMRGAVEQWTQGEMEERNASESITATLFYGSNNPFVAIITGAMAAGSFGVLTTDRLYQNGALLGVLYSECEKVGRGGYLLARISPHGVTELSGIVLSGGAGYVMAWALICPGRRSRAQALKEGGVDAIVLLAGSVILMFMAAPIEGFFSFNPAVPPGIKVLFAVATAIAWGAFWIGYGRDRTAEREAAAIPTALD